MLKNTLSPNEKPNNDISKGKIIFKNKCNQCHPLSRSLSKNKGLGGWQKTTTRMARKTQNRKKTKIKNRVKKRISQKEAGKIAKYLYLLNNKKK